MYGDNLSDFTLTRYETQLTLPPGEYQLQVIVSDGKKFGRSQTPMTVDSLDKKNTGDQRCFPL